MRPTHALAATLALALMACGSRANRGGGNGGKGGNAGSTITVAGAGGLGQAGGDATGGLGGASSAGGSGGTLDGVGGMAASTGVLWAASYGDGLDSRVYGATSVGSDLVFTGYFRNFIDFGGGILPSAAGREGFVARLGPTGAHVHSIGMTASSPSGNVSGFDIVPDGSGGVVVLGWYTASLDLGAGPLPPAATGAFDNNLFVVRFDANGAHQWSLALAPADSASSVQAKGVALASLGGDVVVAATVATPVDIGLGVLPTLSSTDLFVARFDPQGQPVWQRRFGGGSGVVAGRDLGGRLVFGGSFEGTLALDAGLSLVSSANEDAFVLELDPSDGGVLWARSAGGPSTDRVSALTAAPNGDLVLTGRFTTTIDWGGDELVAPSQQGSWYAARLSATGQHVASSVSADTNYAGVAFDDQGHLAFCGQMADRLRLRAFDAQGQPHLDHLFAPHAAPDFAQTLGCVRHPVGLVMFGTYEQTLDLGPANLFTATGDTDLFVGLYAL